MPTARLTKRTVESIPYPASGQVLYRDTMLPGFGLRVGTRSKVYFAEGQVQRRTVRTTIGRANVLSPDRARQKALALLSDMADGVNPNQLKREEQAEQVTVADAFAAFFDAKPHLAKSTVSSYRRSCDVYLRDWRRKPLRDVTRHMVMAQHRKIGEQYGEVTANNVMRHLRSVYNFTAATHDAYPPNPVAILTQARAWNKEQRRRTVVPEYQLPAWWRAVMAETEDARDIMLIALFTGMRRSEILTLRWDYVDLPGRALHLPKTKNGDPLDLPMSDFLCELIAQRQERVGQSEWLFPSRSRTGHVTEVKSFTRRVTEASGVNFSMHDLRRTFITIAESLDVPAYALKRLLNHRVQYDVTGGYIVMDVERLRGPVDKVASKILELADAT